MARSGLKKVVKTVKGKKKTVRRTYWVKSESPKKKGLGPGGMIKRGGMYHRFDTWVGKAKPWQRAALLGTAVGLTTLGAMGAAWTLGGKRGKQSSSSQSTHATVGGSAPEGTHRSMGGTSHVNHIDAYKADRERERALHHVPAHLEGSYVHGLARPADARSARHVPYTQAYHKKRYNSSRDWLDNIGVNSMRLGALR